MVLEIGSRFGAFTAPTRHHLPATPATCYWGYIDRDQPPVLEVDDGDIIEVEAVTHHAGDAPDLLMDDGVRALWSGLPEATRGPGVHILTGPIHVRGAEPGDVLAVRILDMTPRLPYGSNCAANWGLLYDVFGKERITIYGLEGDASDGFTATASPLFGFDNVIVTPHLGASTAEATDRAGFQAAEQVARAAGGGGRTDDRAAGEPAGQRRDAVADGGAVV